MSLMPNFAAGPTRVLPSYKRPRSTLERVVKYGGFLALCVFLGLFYGFSFALLPPQLMLYLTAPVLLLALLVIWVLPDTGRGPVRTLSWLFYAYLIVMVIWPNYLALQLPGLPWISFRRLVIFPMALIFLICLSVSSRFRTQLADAIREVKPLWVMIALFSLVQLLTTPMSANPFSSLNGVTNYLFGLTTVFFIGAWVLSREGRSSRLVNLMIGSALFICFLGTLELRNRGVLWANHIPSFFQVQDESVSRMLSAATRDAEYRVTTTFSVSLAMAEYLALVTPFVLHRAFSSKTLGWITIWGAIDLALLAIIASTQSRLGVLGWIIAHACYVCLWAFRRWRSERGDIVAPALSLLYPIGTFLFFIAMFTVPAVHNRTIGGGSTGFSDDSRREQFALLWPKLIANPFGYGQSQSGIVLNFRQPGGLLTVDSYIITMAIDFGVIGLFLFFGMIAFGAYKMVMVSWRYRSKEIDLAMPLACSLVIAIQVRLVLSQTDNLPIVYMLLGMAAALAWRARTFDEAQASPAHVPTGGDASLTGARRAIA